MGFRGLGGRKAPSVKYLVKYLKLCSVLGARGASRGGGCRQKLHVVPRDRTWGPLRGRVRDGSDSPNPMPLKPHHPIQRNVKGQRACIGSIGAQGSKGAYRKPLELLWSPMVPNAPIDRMVMHMIVMGFEGVRGP